MKSFEENETRISNYIHELDKITFKNHNGVDVAMFDAFLDSLSKTIICTKLHPSVSNVFWEKLYFVSTNVSEYVNDYKNVYKHGNNNYCNLCEKIEKLSESLKLFRVRMINCSEIIVNNGPEASDCFEKLIDLYEAFKNKITEIILNENRDYSLIWRKILLTLISNPLGFEHLKNDTGHGRFLDMMYLIIEDYVNVGFRVTCGTSKPNALKRLAHNAVDIPKKVISCISPDVSQNRLQLSNVYRCKTFFQTVDKLFADCARKESEIDTPNRVGDKLQLYRDGVGMTLADVRERDEKYSFDPMRDSYDNLRFLVNWTLAVVYSKLVAVVDEIVISKVVGENITGVLSDLGSKFKQFMNLPLYVSTTPVEPILDMFVNVLKSYDGSDTEDLTYYREILREEFKCLDVVHHSITATKDSFDNSINTLIDTIDRLLSIFKTYETQIQDEAKELGINQSDLLMMFHEWK